MVKILKRQLVHIFHIKEKTVEKYHIHLVSDSTGETVGGVVRACLAQFDDLGVQQHCWGLVRSEGQLQRVIEGIKANPGLVLFTLVDSDARIKLEEECKNMEIECISVLDPVMNSMSLLFKANIKAMPGKQHVLDNDYFKRIDAMDFTLAHDDGLMAEDLGEADVILVGISRTSKTPTCMYLANKGIKAANIPLVPEIELPEILFDLTKPLIVGLTKDAMSLTEIRRSRLRFLNQSENIDYADPSKVYEEIRMARKLFSKHNWPVVDVTKKSIEEASAAIIQLLEKKKNL